VNWWRCKDRSHERRIGQRNPIQFITGLSAQIAAAFALKLVLTQYRLECFTSPGILTFFAGFNRSHKIESDNSIGFFGYFPNLVTKMTTFIVFSVLENIGLPVFWDKFRLKIFSLFSGRWFRLAKLCSVKQLTCAVPSWLGTRYTHTHTHTPTGSGTHEVWCLLSLRWRHGISGGWSDGIRHATNRITWPGSYESCERCHVTSNIPIKTQSRHPNPRDPIAN